MNKAARQIPKHIFLSTFGAIFFLPVVLMLVMSFKSTQEIFMNPFGLPKSLTLASFYKAWTVANFGTYIWNSLFVTITSVLLVLACASMVAHAIARYTFRGNGLTLFFFLITIMIPIKLGVLPLFLLMQRLHLLNTHWSLILIYAASGMPFSVFLLTGFFQALPKELEYAARIDGCNEFQVFWRVMLPLARPGLGTVAIFNFVSLWNEFFFPLIFIRSDRLKTIPVGMTMFFGTYQTDWGMLFAGMVMASLPMLVVYLIASKQLISGLTAGAVKG